MKIFMPAFSAILLAIVIAGCATTDVSSRHPYRGPQLARPEMIHVHDFAASVEDLPRWALAEPYAVAGGSQTAEDLATGRRLGAEVAKELVARIRAMGLPTERAADRMSPKIGDLVIMGYFETIDPGSATERMAIGFGSGATDLRTVVQGYLMTERGLQRLGSGEVDAEGSKSPGEAAPLAIALASGNPVGLIVSTAVKVEGEASGQSTIEGSAKRTADLIAQKLQEKFIEQGWI